MSVDMKDIINKALETVDETDIVSTFSKKDARFSLECSRKQQELTSLDDDIKIMNHQIETIKKTNEQLDAGIGDLVKQLQSLSK